MPDTGRTEELIFHPQSLHNHGSCLVEWQAGELVACWYRGTGERKADDARIFGSVKKQGEAWSEPFVMADTPGFPDMNPFMFVDRNRRLWLFRIAVLDNQWESSLLKYRISSNLDHATGQPIWEEGDTLLLKPGPEFHAAVERDLDNAWSETIKTADEDERALIAKYLSDKRAHSQVKLSVRLGWMGRAHAFLEGSRILLPLYSDGFDFSLVAISENDGVTWTCSEPIIGPAAVQPSIAKRSDGTLAAFFRNNGPAPHNVMRSLSTDNGYTWTQPNYIELNDPGAGLEVLRLQSGRWILVHNNTERGRHRMAASISEDEGDSWKRFAQIENNPPGPEAGTYAYPSVIQTEDGLIHATYTWRPTPQEALVHGPGESIKHLALTEDWILDHSLPLDGVSVQE